jgi:hypothetical protein
MNPFFATARCPYMLFACVAAVGLLRADDNAPGAYTISAAAASTMLLEAVGGGTTDGTVVSIGVPCGQAKQIWNIVPKGDKTYVIRPSYSRTLALTVKDGATADGTSVVLATENDQPAQLWSIQQTPDGSFGLLPQVAPGKSLDDYGGHNNPGAQINIWAYQPKDRNTQWLITPLAGAPMPFTALPAADLVRRDQGVHLRGQQDFSRHEAQGNRLYPSAVRRLHAGLRLCAAGRFQEGRRRGTRGADRRQGDAGDRRRLHPSGNGDTGPRSARRGASQPRPGIRQR